MDSAAAKSMIRFDNVSKSFGHKTPIADMRKKVLDGVSLTVSRGEILCMLGPSGCGKTTCVNLIMGNLVADAGYVEVMGELAPYAGVRSKIGFMPQDEALYDDVTAIDNLKFFGAMYGMKSPEVKKRADEVLAFGRLQDDAKKLVSAYSGGMKRRLSLGVALMHEPELLVLDEPTVGLDPDHRRRIWDYFEKLAASGCTILVTTHVMDEAERCSRIVMLHGGRVIADGSPSEIKDRAGAKDLESAFITLEDSEEADYE